MFTSVYQCGNSCIFVGIWFIVWTKMVCEKFLFLHFLARRMAREYTPAFFWLIFFNIPEFLLLFMSYIYLTRILKASFLKCSIKVSFQMWRKEWREESERTWCLAGTPYLCDLYRVPKYKVEEYLIFLPSPSHLPPLIWITTSVLKKSNMNKSCLSLLFSVLFLVCWAIHSVWQFSTF